MCKSFKNCLCVYKHFPEHSGHISGLTPLFLMRPLGAWGAVLCLRGPTGRGSESVSKVRQKRLGPSQVTLGKSVYLRALVCLSIKEDVGGTYQRLSGGD